MLNFLKMLSLLCRLLLHLSLMLHTVEGASGLSPPSLLLSFVRAPVVSMGNLQSQKCLLQESQYCSASHSNSDPNGGVS